MHKTDNQINISTLTLPTEDLSEVIAVVGRRTGAIKDVVEDGDVVIQFENETTVRISNEEIAGDKKGYILTFTWQAPKGVGLEDCVNLGKNILNGFFSVLMVHHWISPVQNYAISKTLLVAEQRTLKIQVLWHNEQYRTCH